MLQVIIKWLSFRILLALLPILLNALRIVSETGAGTISLSALCGKGELVLIVSAICGGAIGELVGSPNIYESIRYVVAATGVVFIGCSAGWYSLISGRISSNLPYDVAAVSLFSVYFYAMGFIVALSSIIVVEAGKRVQN